MGSCNDCKFWSKPSKPEIKTQIKHLKELQAFYKLDKRFPDNVVTSISLEIIRLENEAKKGSCWRFPSHIDTYSNHFCGEFKDADPDHF